jgi:hypothetical protein
LASSAGLRVESPGNFPDWTAKEVDRLLTDSPWSRPLDVRFRQPFTTRGGASGSVATEANLIVRWASALPVRQATALALGLQTRTAKRLLAEAQPREYVIEVAGFPVSALQGGPAGLRESMQASARLMAPDKSQRPPVSVEVPEHGTHVVAEVRFSAEPALAGGKGVVEFTATAGAMRIRAKFALETMRYQGALAL